MVSRISTPDLRSHLEMCSTNLGKVLFGQTRKTYWRAIFSVVKQKFKWSQISRCVDDLWKAKISDRKREKSDSFPT